MKSLNSGSFNFPSISTTYFATLFDIDWVQGRSEYQATFVFISVEQLFFLSLHTEHASNFSSAISTHVWLTQLAKWDANLLWDLSVQIKYIAANHFNWSVCSMNFDQVADRIDIICLVSVNDFSRRPNEFSLLHFANISLPMSRVLLHTARWNNCTNLLCNSRECV